MAGKRGYLFFISPDKKIWPVKREELQKEMAYFDGKYGPGTMKHANMTCEQFLEEKLESAKETVYFN